MASPLLPYANSRLLIRVEDDIAIVNGRIQATSIGKVLVKCFLKRQQYSGVSSGSKKLPLESQLDGRMLPGASGDQFFYRGYALEYASVASNWTLDTVETGLTWTPVTTQFEWMLPGTTVQMRFGADPQMLNSTIERSSGVFGGQGIDEIVYQEIGGVQIQLTAGEVQN
jgi:hypothetical protein